MKATNRTAHLKNLRASALALLLAIGAGGLLAGCDDGPAEEAGETLDDGVDDAGDAVDDTFD